MPTAASTKQWVANATATDCELATRLVVLAAKVEARGQDKDVHSDY